KNIGQSGRPVVLLGSALPEQFECSPERRYFESLHYLTLVCDSEVLDARLCARPAWRGSGTTEVRETMRMFNSWLGTNAARTEPAMTTLDTSTMPIAEAVDSVARWIRERS
ncbi:MAG: nucleoside kinase, partial [Kofleriaceae bacterium]